MCQSTSKGGCASSIGELPLYYGGGSGLRVTVTAAGYYVIIGDDEDEEADGVYAAFYGPVGDLVIDKFLVNSATRGDQFEPEIAALAGGGFVIVWTHYDPDAEGGYVNEIRGQVFDANGRPAPNGSSRPIRIAATVASHTGRR